MKRNKRSYRVARLRSEGLTWTQIGKKIGRSRARAYQIYMRHNAPPRLLTARARYCLLDEMGYSRKYCISDETLFRMAKRAGFLERPELIPNMGPVTIRHLREVERKLDEHRS